MWPIVHIVRGQAIQDITVEGYLVPKGSTVIGLLHGTMHDPTVFKNPDSYFSPCRPCISVLNQMIMPHTRAKRVFCSSVFAEIP
jgi:hypothetical protein